MNKDDMQIFMHVVFGWCSGLVPLRSFAEKGNCNSKPIGNVWVKVDDDLLNQALSFANLANKGQAAFYVIPGTVAKSNQARSADVIEMQVLLIDIDDGDTEEKLLRLSAVLGEPTMVVESGGITEEGRHKLHIYWQLEKAANGSDLRTLLDLRYSIALAFGGDTHFKSVHQPIRVAGSIYHKGEMQKLVSIRSYSPVEYTLDELVDRVSDYLKEEGKKDGNEEGKEEDIVSNSKDTPRILHTHSSHGSNVVVPITNILMSKVYEGSNTEHTRFNVLSKVTGYWLRRYHDGLISRKEALDEIESYNLANVVPSWPHEKLMQTVDGLWKLHVEKYGEPKKLIKLEKGGSMSTTDHIATNDDNKHHGTISSFSISAFLSDKSSLPEDIIAPRILTPGGMLVFGGAPKVGKSDFLLSLFVHLAAGKEFLGFIPPRPLKIFYYQAEIGYHYLRERLQNMQLTDELIKLGENNLYITPNTRMILNESCVNELADHIKGVFPDGPDIIAVDPVRNVFDGGRDGATENENDAMLFFLQQRIETLRDKVNTDAGIILVHHTKKMSKFQFEEDPFQAFSGASSLRGYYSSGALLYKPDTESNDLKLMFELRNGANIETKLIAKKEGAWVEKDALNKRIAYKTQGRLYDLERSRKIDLIIELLERDALKGKFYLMKQFAEKFQNHKDLGGKRAIYDDCSVAATKGYIKFFDNPGKYGLDLKAQNAAFGFICTKNMHMPSKNIVNADTGEVMQGTVKILATHYKGECDGRKNEMLDPNNWCVDLEQTAKTIENTNNQNTTI